MPVTLLAEPPRLEDFVPRSQHESFTPDSFFDGPPVLYLVEESCSLVASRADIYRYPDLLQWWSPPPEASHGGDSHTPESKMVKGQVGMMVSTDALVFFKKTEHQSNELPEALSVSYPAIGLHAVQQLEENLGSSIVSVNEQSALTHRLSAVYLQIDPWHEESNLPFADPMEPTVAKDPIEIYVVPQPLAQVHDGEESRHGGYSSHSQTSAVYEALSACADLWPDDESEPPDDTSRLELGSGWITADNIHEYQHLEHDDNGDGIDDGSLAGQRRRRTDTDQHVNDDLDQHELTKWRRTG